MYVQIKRSPPQQLRFFPQVFLGFVLRDPRRRAPGGELHAAAGCRLVHGGHRGPGAITLLELLTPTSGVGLTRTCYTALTFSFPFGW